MEVQPGGVDADLCSSPQLEHSVSVDTVSVGTTHNIRVADIVLPEGFDDWAPCKQLAWQQMSENPNAFYYRHRLPDEEKRNGAWDAEEKRRFIEEAKKYPTGISQWGLFARNIPGRVGYQCNAFYKKLVLSGEILLPDGLEIASRPHPAPAPIPQTDVVSSQMDAVDMSPTGSPTESENESKSKCDWCGDNFAYQHNITNGTGFSFIPKMELGCTFREWLCEWLRDDAHVQDFSSKTDVYPVFRR
jgi:hypothetical protein